MRGVHIFSHIVSKVLFEDSLFTAIKMRVQNFSGPAIIINIVCTRLNFYCIFSNFSVDKITLCDIILIYSSLV